MCVGVGVALQSARGVWRQRSTISIAFSTSAPLQSARGVWRQREQPRSAHGTTRVAICTGRVEAKWRTHKRNWTRRRLQSARGVWRQRPWTSPVGATESVAICTGRVEAKLAYASCFSDTPVAICTGRVEAKKIVVVIAGVLARCNLHGACGGKEFLNDDKCKEDALQSARGVWRQRSLFPAGKTAMWLQSARGVWRQSYSAF